MFHWTVFFKKPDLPAIQMRYLRDFAVGDPDTDQSPNTFDMVTIKPAT